MVDYWYYFCKQNRIFSLCLCSDWLYVPLWSLSRRNWELFSQVKGSGVKLLTHVCLVPRLIMCESVPPFPICLHVVVLYNLRTVTSSVSSESSVSYYTVEFYGFNLMYCIQWTLPSLRNAVLTILPVSFLHCEQKTHKNDLITDI